MDATRFMLFVGLGFTKYKYTFNPRNIYQGFLALMNKTTQDTQVPHLLTSNKIISKLKYDLRVTKSRFF